MEPLALLVALAVSLDTSMTFQGWSSPVRNVRSTQERTLRLLDVGAERSPTIARLRAALEQSDVIVYVQTVRDLAPSIDGRMMLLNAGHGRRYVRVDIRQSLTPREMLAIIGHELRHALEIADAREVRDDQSMIELYRRIGVSRDARSHFETIAARAAGSQVRAELGGGQLRTRNERPPAAGSTSGWASQQALRAPW
ncbi:MAG TPA: hypothetical protein VHJ77_18260 [Vicinamibacterales bacterium]|jgi:hypothetical protein|nr:hypothetical protein [Vicinamibacterales bacterium]